MDLKEIIELDKEFFMNAFGDRLPVCFEKGRGIKLWSIDGTEYLDFFGGIAVTSIGHSNPAFVKAVKEQVGKFIHCSNYYYIQQQAELARTLVENSCAGKVFFGNSGAEANECAFKLARLHFRKKGQSGKYGIISLNESFHGRTLATLAATGQEKYRTPFEPLTPGFKFVDANDFEALKAAATPDVCAIILEPVQGESGIKVMDRDFLQKTRELCDEMDIILIFDEVQCGLGRTGKLFAYEHYGVEPDIFTLAKSLGGGIPISACCAKDRIAVSMSPGDHGSTFGGNPLACAAGNAVMKILLEKHLPKKAAVTGKYFFGKLDGLKKKHGVISGTRGMGLMIGLVLNKPVAAELKLLCLESGYLVGAAGNDVLRFLPPLTVSRKDIDRLIEALDKILTEKYD